MPSDSSVDIIIRLRDEVSRQVKNIRGALKKIGSGLKDLKGILFNLKSALLSVGIGLFAKSLLDAGVALEKLNLTLKAATGGFKEAGEASKFLREESNRLGLVYKDQIGIFSQVAASAKGTALEGQATRDVWLSLAKASTVLQLSNEDTKGAMTALTQIISKGKLSAEELRQQLGERLPGAFQIAAKAMGVTTQELDKMLANGEIMSEEFIPKFSKALTERFGPDVELAAQSWTANINRMKNIWFEFRTEIMSNGLFNFLKAGLAEVLTRIQKLQKNGDLSKWAKESSNALIGLLNFFAKLGAVIAETFIVMKRAFIGFTTLINLVLKQVFEGLSGFVNKLSVIAKKLHANDIAGKLDSISETLKGIGEVAGEEADKGITKLIGLAETQGQAWNKTIEFLDTVKNKAKDLDKQAKDAIENAQSTVKDELIVPKLTDTDRLKSELKQLEESTKTGLAILDASYEQGKIALDKYYNEKKAKLEEVYNAEIALNKKLADEQDKDPTKKQQYLDKAFAIQEELNRELIKLDEDRYKKQETLDKQAFDKQQILNDVKKRNAFDYTDSLISEMDRYLAELDSKHADEIQKLIELNASKAEIDELYRQQKIEKDKATLDQERKLFEKRQEMLATSADNIKSAFEDLYSTLGEDQKEFFYLAKAAALAEAIINNSLAVTKAYSQGGIYGFVAAAALALKGGVEIAKISAQTLAEGGIVAGVSPNPKADDKLIAATSGEFMMKRAAVDKYGVGFMELINSGRFNIGQKIRGMSLPSNQFAFAEGGLIGNTNFENITGRTQTEKNEITIVNYTDPLEMERFLSTNRGQRAVINAISSNSSEVSRVIQR